MQKFFTHTLFQVLVLCFLIVIPYRFLLGGQLFESDDYELHAARTANYYLALQQGQFPPRWAPNLNGGFGYPSFNYMYPLPYVVASSLHVLHFSIQESLLLSLLGALVAGGIGAFFLSRQMLGKGIFPLLLAASYVLNPYTFILVYWRGAIGELYLYCIVPLILLFLHQVFASYKKTSAVYLYGSLLALSTTAAILSHLPSMLPLAGICIGWIIVLERKHSALRNNWRKTTAGLAYAALATLMLSAFYFIPAIVEKPLISYEQSNSVLQYKFHFTTVAALIDFRKTITSSTYMSEVLQFGIAILGTLILVVIQIALSKQMRKQWLNLFIWLGLFVLFCFLMTKSSQFIWDQSSLIRMIQFPWRLLWTANALILCLSFELLQFSNKNILVRNALIFTITFGIMSSVLSYAHIKPTYTRTDYEWYESVITGSSYDEHRPRTAVRYYSVPGLVFFKPTADLEKMGYNWDIFSGPFQEKNGTTLSYTITLPTATTVVHKRLLFPGWSASVDGKPAQFVQQSSDFAGLLQLAVPAGTHTITVRFDGKTPIRTYSEYLTLVGFIGTALVLVVSAQKLIPNPIHPPLGARHSKRSF